VAHSTVATPQFTLAYDSFEPAEEGLREALTSTGNGYFCTRGAAEWEDADEVHYPGTYAHGGYNRETTIMGGRPVLNEDLVNLPNWLLLKLRIEGEEPIGLGNVELLSYRHELDIRNATVARALRFRDRAGRETTLRSRRFGEHGPHAPGRHRVDDHAGELVGPHRAGDGARWTGHEPGSRPLPAARGPSPRSGLPQDVRPGGHRAEMHDPAVEDHAAHRRARVQRPPHESLSGAFQDRRDEPAPRPELLEERRRDVGQAAVTQIRS
jgi:hypothetical protein